MPEDALAGGSEDIGINESAEFGVIIAGLQVIETGFYVVELAARPKYTGRTAPFTT